MSADPRKLAENILGGWTIITVQLEDTARLDSRHLVLARELLAALESKMMNTRAEKAEARADALEAALEAIVVGRTAKPHAEVALEALAAHGKEAAP